MLPKTNSRKIRTVRRRFGKYKVVFGRWLIRDRPPPQKHYMEPLRVSRRMISRAFPIWALVNPGLPDCPRGFAQGARFMAKNKDRVPEGPR
jgi:hypothetical protein